MSTASRHKSWLKPLVKIQSAQVVNIGSASTGSYLNKKNGGLDTADRHLITMLASQIEIYVESISKLRSDGLVVAFNGGMTVGPNPYMAIADKALYRSVQVMKELELSPKSRDGYQSKDQLSPEMRSLLDGP